MSFQVLPCDTVDRSKLKQAYIVRKLRPSVECQPVTSATWMLSIAIHNSSRYVRVSDMAIRTLNYIYIYEYIFYVQASNRYSYVLHVIAASINKQFSAVAMAACVSADTTSSGGPSNEPSLVEGSRVELETETAPSSSCVCRDFLRNVCRRGDRCRFQHPADPTSARRDVIAAVHHRPLVFCHDFQNATGCKRGTSCRFAHCTREEEATYRRTGLLPVHVQRKLALDLAIAKSLLRGETPVCLDYIKAGGCRYAILIYSTSCTIFNLMSTLILQWADKF